MKIFGVRVSRPCYNKFWRCPGWAGPGWKMNKEGRNWCGNGHGSRLLFGGLEDEEKSFLGVKLYLPRWRSWRCPECRTLVLPSNVRYLDPRHWVLGTRWWISDKIEDWRFERKWRRRNR